MRRWVVALAILLMAFPATAQERVSATFARWSLVRRTDPISDVNTSYVYTPGARRGSLLVVKCTDQGITALEYIWGGYLIDDDRGQIEIDVRFGTAAALPREAWSMSAAHESAYIPEGRIRSFVETAETAAFVTLRATDANDGEQKVDRFSLAGFSAAIKALTCAKL